MPMTFIRGVVRIRSEYKFETIQYGARSTLLRRGNRTVSLQQTSFSFMAVHFLNPTTSSNLRRTQLGGLGIKAVVQHLANFPPPPAPQPQASIFQRFLQIERRQALGVRYTPHGKKAIEVFLVLRHTKHMRSPLEHKDLAVRP